jgi:hypothetical protein
MCNYYGTKLLFEFGMTPSSISMDGYSVDKVPEQLNELRTYSYRDVDVGKYAQATTRRYLKKAHIDWDDSFEQDVYCRFVYTVVQLVDVAHDLFEERDISAVVAHHPVYAYGGVYLAVAEQYGVPAVSLGVGYNDSTIMFGNQRNRSPVPTFTDTEYLKTVVGEPLSEDAATRIEELMAERASGANLRVDVSTRGSRTIDESSDETLIGLFTNLTWDAAIEADSIVYEDTYEWVDDTIERFGGHDSISLLLKPHPAEALRGTKEPVVEWLRQRHGQLPDNVIALEPDTDINPYSLMDDIDVGVVYSSTIGLEMAYHDVPVVVVNDTHYRDLGFTFDPTTPSEYQSQLEASADLTMDDEMRRRAKRYAYFVFIRKQHPFPYYTQDNLDVELKPVAHDELTPGNEPFDTIVDRVLADGPVVRSDEW